jgi:hypothetical protein
VPPRDMRTHPIGTGPFVPSLIPEIEIWRVAVVMVNRVR